MNTSTLTLEIDGILIPVTPDGTHEWTLATEQVATGYGVTPQALRMVKQRHGDELIEGTHWGVTVCDTPGGAQEMTRWTKVGVITLGFFIRSDRAKRFRRLAAELILRVGEGAAALNPGLPDLTALVGAIERLTALNLTLMERMAAGPRPCFRETPLVVYSDPRGSAVRDLVDHVLENGGDLVRCEVGELAAIARRVPLLGYVVGAEFDKAAQSRWGKWLKREIVGKVFETRHGERYLAARDQVGTRPVIEFIRLDAA